MSGSGEAGLAMGSLWYFPATPDDNDEEIADDPYGKHDRWQVKVKDTG